jgi:ornithine decarboxylase
VHLAALRSRVALWKQALPDIRPFYAVKCNQLSPILMDLHQQGCGFDCASADEIRKVRAVGAGASDIIYANPCKSRPDIRFARTQGVQWATFDTTAELKKLYDEHDNPKPVLRIHVDDRGSARIPLNKKFGFQLGNLSDLIRLNKPIYGLAFHVGSDCRSTLGYLSALETVAQYQKRLKGYTFFIPERLDVGGGFSGESKDDTFFSGQVAPILQRVSGFDHVIAEPGRFFATQACTLQVPILGKKSLTDGTPALTIDESIYGMLSGVFFDGFKPHFIPNGVTGPSIPYTILGRTCDSADVIAKDVLLPACIQEGDVLTIKNIGAYSYASASEFNGFPKPTVVEENGSTQTA